MTSTNIYSIYTATNKLNGKVYVGFTTDFERRKSEHIRKAKLQNTPFQKAIMKYGHSCFVWSVIFQGTILEDILNWAEPHFIKEYNSHVQCHGYNITFGGEGTVGKSHSVISKAKISENKKSLKGISYHELYGEQKANELKAHRKICGQQKDNSGKNNPMYDNCIHKVAHSDGTLFIGYRSEFITQFNFPRASASRLFSGIRTKGWCLVSSLTG